MNGLDSAAATEGAGIVRGPPWQAEADLAARCTCSSMASRLRRRCT
jgi:hypothetical protein